MPSLPLRGLAAVALTIGLLSATPAGAATAPPAPTGVKITPGTTTATITWKASPGATYYGLCLVEAIDSTRCAHQSPRVTGTTYTFTGLKPTDGTDFFVRVRANNATGGTNSTRTGFDLATVSRPAAPTQVAVTPGFDSAKITWQPAAGADYYALCLVEEIGATTCSHRSPRVTGTTYTFTGLVPTDGTDYAVRINSTNAAGVTSSARVPFDLAPDPRPATPTGLTHRTTGTTATVSWKAAPRATRYAVCLLATKTSTACAQTRTTTSTTAQFDGLTAKAGSDYAYRVTAQAGTYATASTLGTLDLAVGSVPSLNASAQEVGSARTWWHTATNAGGYQVQYALNSTMTSGLKTFSSPIASITSTGLSPGRLYHYRVRGTNDSTTGAWSKNGTVRVRADGTVVTVLTYNLCGQDKCVTSSNKMRTWKSYRKTAAGSYVRGTQSGIIATQESHDEDTRFGTELPGYNLAAYYSAKSLYYDTDLYSRERAGTITLSAADKKYAVWGEFRDVKTGTRFIVVDAHLQPFKGKSNDDKRLAQSNVLISAVTKLNTEKLPVVYAGDFNSNKSNADQSRYKYGYDAPLRAFRAAGIPDTVDTVDDADRVAADWNSANQAINPPLRYGDHVDHVFATKGIDVLEWRIMRRIADGRYVTPFASDHNPLRVELSIPGS